MSVAIDTIDHTVLLKRLSCSFGVAGNVHSWIHSYLTGRTQSVRIGSHSSPPSSCSIGVPQGSVLGPLRFSIGYTLHPSLPLLTCTKSVSRNMQTTRNCMWLCRLLTITMTLVHFSHAWHLCRPGSAKAAWPSTHLSQSPFSLAHHKGLNLCLILNASLYS